MKTLLADVTPADVLLFNAVMFVSILIAVVVLTVWVRRQNRLSNRKLSLIEKQQGLLEHLVKWADAHHTEAVKVQDKALEVQVESKETLREAQKAIQADGLGSKTSLPKLPQDFNPGGVV